MFSGQSGQSGFIKYWRGSKILREAECAWANLNLSSQIFASIHLFRKSIVPPKKYIKILNKSRFVSSINFENKIVPVFSDYSFFNHRTETEQISKSSTSNLRYQSAFAQMTKCLLPHLCSAHFALRQMSMKQVITEAGLQLFLKRVKLLGKHLSWTQSPLTFP